MWAKMVGVLKIHWFLPTGGDSRDVLPTAPTRHPRAPDLAYLAQVARPATDLGFDGHAHALRHRLRGRLARHRRR